MFTTFHASLSNMNGQVEPLKLITISLANPNAMQLQLLRSIHLLMKHFDSDSKYTISNDAVCTMIPLEHYRQEVPAGRTPLQFLKVRIVIY